MCARASLVFFQYRANLRVLKTHVNGDSMSKLLWEIEGEEYGNCNCDYGCPCQFNALPTHGNCQAFAITKVDRGYHGDTSLDGLLFGFAVDFPKAVHEGNGTHQVYIDVSASQQQRDALLRIATGLDTDAMATHFAVYYEMSSNRLDPVFLPMSCEIDLESATAQSSVGDIVTSRCEPIRNPITDEEHRAQIHLPNGFEYITAEMASGGTRATGDIPLNLANSYAQLNKLHMGSAGLIR